MVHISEETSVQNVSVNKISVQDSDLLKQFWEIENDAILPTVQKFSDEERVVMEKLESSISYDSDQHKYTVEIPYKDNLVDLEENKQISQRIFFAQEKRMAKDDRLKNGIVKVFDTLKKSIVSVFETLKSEGWVERVSTCDIYTANQMHYMP